MFCALANVNTRSLERGYSGTSKLVGSWLRVREDCFRMTLACPIPTSCQQFNTPLNSVPETPSLSSSSQTHLKKYGNSPEYLHRGKRKAFVNTFPSPKSAEIPTVAACREKENNDSLQGEKEHVYMGAFSPIRS